MFAKDNKVTQSMLDAVNSVLDEGSKLLLEPQSEKVPTPTGTKVYGHSYGNSAKARKDQTSHEIDKLKGPKDKEMKEAAKPDFLDMDKDGNKKESMKKAIADKSVKEELKGNQDKIDANHNDKIDSQDFKILRGKKKVKEGMEFASKLLETVRKSDVPAYLRKAKGDTPLTMADVKSPKKDSISAPENLAKAKNEEVELDESLDNGYKIKMKHSDKGRVHTPTGEHIGDVTKETGGWRYHGGHHSKWLGNESGPHYKTGVEKTKEAAANKVAQIHHSSLSEEVEQVNEYSMDDVRKDAAAGLKKSIDTASDKRIDALKNPPKKKSFLQRVGDKQINMVKGAWHGLTKEDITEEELDEQINEVLSKNADAGDYIHDFIHSDNPKFAGKSKAERKKMALGAYYGKQNEESEKATIDTLSGRSKKVPKEAKMDNYHSSAKVELKAEATIAGSPGWKKSPSNIVDKSGAVHSPMSRAKDLARLAFKRIQDKTKIKPENK